MMKGILNFGKELTKEELQEVHGGGGTCVSSAGGDCSYTHNYCEYNFPNEYEDCMITYGCACYLPSKPRKPKIIIDV